MSKFSYWLGFPPAQSLLKNREYKGIAINPQNLIAIQKIVDLVYEIKL